MKKITNNLILELHIPDFDKARRFYEIFGFSQVSYDPTSGGGSDLGYMVIARSDPVGRTLINFYGDKEKVSKHAHFKDFPENTPRGYEVEITIPVEDVEKLWEHVIKRLDPSQMGQEGFQGHRPIRLLCEIHRISRLGKIRRIDR